jgi:DNA polymerase III subunit epsilon
MQLHHINEAMVSAAPCFNEEWPEIWRRIKGRSLIAWNAAFDAGRLKYAAVAHNVELPPLEWYCAMREYAKHSKFQFQRIGLAQACEYHGIVHSEAHRALADTNAMVEIFRCVARNHGASRPSETQIEALSTE